MFLFGVCVLHLRYGFAIRGKFLNLRLPADSKAEPRIKGFQTETDHND